MPRDVEDDESHADMVKKILSYCSNDAIGDMTITCVTEALSKAQSSHYKVPVRLSSVLVPLSTPKVPFNKPLKPESERSDNMPRSPMLSVSM